MTADVTVAICTRDRAAMLKDCIASLRRQTLPSALFRILVVDNASTDDTPAMIAAMAAGNPFLRYVREDREGVSHARNRALAECDTPVIAFMDDDQIADEAWLDRIVDPYRGTGRMPLAVGGDVEPIWEQPRPTWLKDSFLPLYSCKAGFSTERRPLDPNREWIFEGNCAAHVAALRSLGGFSPTLGRDGSSLLSGEGVVFLIAMLRGATVLFEPAARMHHRIHADRLSLTWLRRRMFWQGVTRARMNRYLAERGLTPPPHHLRLPESREAWLDLSNLSEETENIEQEMMKIYDLGFFSERMGLVT